ncbi:hypothetical protein [Amycolatopsis sp. NPDC059021]|uniref:hypothetical protein n=1 Tax=Amycolatopsis sp. NPDC059021 TaxID=3346704 RepID=UPI00366FA5B4
MPDDPAGGPAPAEALSRLADRFCPNLPDTMLTPHQVAAAVASAVAVAQPNADETTQQPVGVSAIEALAALLLIPAARRDIDSLEVALIEAALDRSVTWEQLGSLYGVRTPHAMQQLYRRRSGTRSWAHDGSPVLASPNDDERSSVGLSRSVPEVAGTWHVALRRGCRAGDEVLRDVLPVVVQLETRRLHGISRPWPAWLAQDKTLSRRARSAVRSFERIHDSGSTIVVLPAQDATGALAPRNSA